MTEPPDKTERFYRPNTNFLSILQGVAVTGGLADHAVRPLDGTLRAAYN